MRHDLRDPRQAAVLSFVPARPPSPPSSVRELDFDVLVPWAATAEKSYYATTDRADARHRIDAILERVRRGGDR
jgi:hypothetical protein